VVVFCQKKILLSETFSQTKVAAGIFLQFEGKWTQNHCTHSPELKYSVKRTSSSQPMHMLRNSPVNPSFLASLCYRSIVDRVSEPLCFVRPGIQRTRTRLCAARNPANPACVSFLHDRLLDYLPRSGRMHQENTGIRTWYGDR
jgi:hypothetical protein